MKMSSRKMDGTLVIVALLVAHVDRGFPLAFNEVTVLEGHTADLPCVTTPMDHLPQNVDDPNARPKLILWYKEGMKSTFYSYDGRTPDKERHWYPRRALGGPLNLTLPSSPFARPQLAFLRISHVHETDGGVYKCRVDFRRGRSRNTHTRLDVVAPPDAPLVEVWASGQRVHTTNDSPAAIVEVDTELTLRCSASGGRPSPTVTWWRAGQKLLGDVRTGEDGTITNSVTVRVRPEDAQIPIVCQASNTHLVPPLRRPVMLQVMSPPRYVRVVGAEQVMSAGEAYTLECQSVGAQPPPVLTWAVAGEEPGRATQSTDSQGLTTSRLRYTPTPAHVGAHVTCTARPPDHSQYGGVLSTHAVPSTWSMTDSVPLKIMYKPEVQLELQRISSSTSASSSNSDGANLPDRQKVVPFTPSESLGKKDKKAKEERKGGDKGKKNQSDFPYSPFTGEDDRRHEEVEGIEGQDMGVPLGVGVALQCNVRAYPPANHISWYHNGLPLTSGSRLGVVVTNMSVVVPRVSKDDAGSYTCTALNSEGSTKSNIITLYVRHVPECTRSAPHVVGVPRHHTVNITCEVSAFPPPTSFTWELRSSSSVLPVPPAMVRSDGWTSWMSYTPRATLDFGELLCRASSPLGLQERPCVTKIVLADKPDPPEACRVTKQMPNALTVACTPAHDGGLPQTFFMTVFLDDEAVSNSSSATSKVTAGNLQPATSYTLNLWSANTHGSSSRVVLHASTSATNASRTTTTSSMNGHDTTSPEKEKGVLAQLGSSLLAVVVIVCFIGIILGVVAGILTQRVVVATRTEDVKNKDDLERGRGDRSGRRGREIYLEEEGRKRRLEREESRKKRRREGVLHATASATTPRELNNQRQVVSHRGGGSLRDGPKNELRKPPVRYDIVAIAAVKHDSTHIYDDPIAIRTHQESDDDDIIKVIPEIPRYPTFSLTASDWDFRNKSFSWHLPNSRLLRTKSDIRSPNRGSPRKPLRVESPKPPGQNGSHIGDAEAEQDTTVTNSERRSKSSGNVEFRLILVPETSKMLQVALERDTRLISYLSKDSTVVSPSKFATISEVEDEAKCLSSDECSSPLIDIDESTPMIPCRRSDTPILGTASTSLEVGGSRRITSSLKPIREHPDEGLASAYEDNDSSHRATSVLHETQDPHTAPRCLQRSSSSSRGQPSPSKVPEESHKTSDFRASQRPLDPSVVRRSVPSLPLVGKLGRRHAFRPVDRPRQAPPAPPEDRRNAEEQALSSHPATINSSSIRRPKLGVTSLVLVPPSSPSSSSSSSSSAFTSSSFSSSSSSLSTSSSTSSSSSKSGHRRSRDHPTSPSAEAVRRSSFRRKFQGQMARPRSAHAPTTSGAEHVLQCCLEGEDDEVPRRGLSASTPSSPRSSSSSSSCFPYSSSSSSPVSSFYSSSTSLSISASLSSQSTSSSSFQFSSSSSSSAISSSSVSSFLSPSLSAPSSSSILSLASCSTSPESVISGHITPS